MNTEHQPKVEDLPGIWREEGNTLTMCAKGSVAHSLGLSAFERANQLEAALSAQQAQAVDYRADAEVWGDALNSAAWEFVEVCPEKSDLLFNHCNTALRAAILKYLDHIDQYNGNAG